MPITIQRSLAIVAALLVGTFAACGVDETRVRIAIEADPAWQLDGLHVVLGDKRDTIGFKTPLLVGISDEFVGSDLLSLPHVPYYATFHKMRNAVNSGTKNDRVVLEGVRRRLPPGWTVEFRQSNRPALSLKAPDGRRATISIVSRKTVEPKDVAHLIQGVATALVIAPFLSPRTRELLAAANMSYGDSTGNLRLTLGSPAVFIEQQGADKSPVRIKRSLQSLKGAAAGRVVRALCDFLPPYGVRALAEISSSPLGTASRVVSLLEAEAVLVRDKKKIINVDWAALIKRWAADYSVTKSNIVHSYLDPRGLPSLLTKLSGLQKYAATGSLAVPESVAPARLAMIYVDDIARAENFLELVPAESGANVWLLEPYDNVVFERTQPLTIGKQAAVGVAISQVIADLMTSPGRGPQEAEALIEKLRGGKHEWRQKP